MQSTFLFDTKNGGWQRSHTFSKVTPQKHSVSDKQNMKVQHKFRKQCPRIFGEPSGRHFLHSFLEYLISNKQSQPNSWDSLLGSDWKAGVSRSCGLSQPPGACSGLSCRGMCPSYLLLWRGREPNDGLAKVCVLLHVAAHTLIKSMAGRSGPHPISTPHPQKEWEREKEGERKNYFCDRIWQIKVAAVLRDTFLELVQLV